MINNKDYSREDGGDLGRGRKNLELDLDGDDFAMELANKKTEIVTNTVLDLLVDEIMNDDFALRELIKLDPNCLGTPKGIKTNMNAIKAY